MQAPNSPSEKKKSGRIYYIDALRVLATLAILLFHSSRVFDLGEDWNVYNEYTTRVANLFQHLFHPWHMQLFILLAGAGTWFALRKRTGQEYTAERFLRIFLPLLFGMFLIQSPLQLYIYRLHRHQFDGNFLQFLPTFYTTGPAIGYRGNLSPEHLWFLLYLFIIAMAALPLLKYLRGEKGRVWIERWAASARNRAWLLFIPPLPIVISQLVLTRLFPWETHAIVDDWPYIVYLFLFFIYGAILMADYRFTEVMVKNWKLALLLAIGPWIYNYSGLVDFGQNELLNLFWLPVSTFGTWFWLVALLGLGKVFLDKPSKLLSHLSEISYPYYIWHQTVIVVLAYFVVQLDASILVKYLLIAALAGVITWALSVAVKWTNVTRFLFGMRTTWNISTQTALRIGVASLIAFGVVFVLAFVIEVDNPQTANFPTPQIVATPTETVGHVSGATYAFDENRAGWKAMTLTFEQDRAAMQLVFEDKSSEYAIGFDGQYLPNSDGTAEATGFWRSDEDFVVYFRRGDYREIWDIKFVAEDEVLFRIRDGVGIRLQIRFTGTRQA
jgi:peptidoglycan/LPS O-acetylase OafA/YrhL